MGSGFDKSKKIVMAIFGVQVEVVAREEVIQGKSSICQMEPRLRDKKACWFFVFY